MNLDWYINVYATGATAAYRTPEEADKAAEFVSIRRAERVRTRVWQDGTVVRDELLALVDRAHDLRRRRDTASAECATATAALSALAEEVSRLPERRLLVPRKDAPGFVHSYMAIEKNGGWEFSQSGERGTADLTPLAERVDAANDVWREKAMAWGDLDRAYKKAVFEAVNS
jgi:hypothetical protein